VHFIHRAPGTTVNNLLAILGVTKQSLNRVLRTLIDDGLVESRVGREDKRERHLFLTPKGAELERALSDAQRARMRAAYRAAGPAAVAGFRQVLEAMMDAEQRAQFQSLRDGGHVMTEAAPLHLLVVDDDDRIRGLLQKFLIRQGYLVSTAGDAARARRLMAGLDFDLVVLDVMMPGEDGVTLTRAMRDQGQMVPVLLLTAKGEAENRIDGLEAGADDYLVKPFEPRELLLRINAILRRVPQPLKAPVPVARILTMGPLRYDIDRAELWQGDQPVRLTTTEVALMRIFAARAGEVVGRDKLVAELGGEAGQASERAVDVQITRLRRKLESDPKQPRYLQTVRGEGYRLAPD
jgi:two-component system, OmpR family, phosphate regulon response regulator OmpR